MLSKNNKLNDIKNSVEKTSDEDLRNFVKHYSATVLGDHDYAENTLIGPKGIARLRSISGSALSPGENTSPDIWSDADAILLEVEINGFKLYNKQDIRMVYAFKKLKRNSKHKIS